MDFQHRYSTTAGPDSQPSAKFKAFPASPTSPATDTKPAADQPSTPSTPPLAAAHADEGPVSFPLETPLTGGSVSYGGFTPLLDTLGSTQLEAAFAAQPAEPEDDLVPLLEGSPVTSPPTQQPPPPPETSSEAPAEEPPEAVSDIAAAAVPLATTLPADEAEYPAAVPPAAAAAAPPSSSVDPAGAYGVYDPSGAVQYLRAEEQQEQEEEEEEEEYEEYGDEEEEEQVTVVTSTVIATSSFVGADNETTEFEAAVQPPPPLTEVISSGVIQPASVPEIEPVGDLAAALAGITAAAVADLAAAGDDSEEAAAAAATTLANTALQLLGGLTFTASETPYAAIGAKAPGAAVAPTVAAAPITIPVQQQGSIPPSPPPPSAAAAQASPRSGTSSDMATPQGRQTGTLTAPGAAGAVSGAATAAKALVSGGGAPAGPAAAGPSAHAEWHDYASLPARYQTTVEALRSLAAARLMTEHWDAAEQLDVEVTWDVPPIYLQGREPMRLAVWLAKWAAAVEIDPIMVKMAELDSKRTALELMVEARVRPHRPWWLPATWLLPRQLAVMATVKLRISKGPAGDGSEDVVTLIDGRIHNAPKLPTLLRLLNGAVLGYLPAATEPLWSPLVGLFGDPSYRNRAEEHPSVVYKATTAAQAAIAAATEGAKSAVGGAAEAAEGAADQLAGAAESAAAGGGGGVLGGVKRTAQGAAGAVKDVVHDVAGAVKGGVEAAAEKVVETAGRGKKAVTGKA